MKTEARRFGRRSFLFLNYIAIFMCGFVFFFFSYFEAAITIGALRTSCFSLAKPEAILHALSTLNLVCFYTSGQIIYSDLTRVLDPQKVANSREIFKKKQGNPCWWNMIPFGQIGLQGLLSKLRRLIGHPKVIIWEYDDWFLGYVLCVCVCVA